MLGREADFSTAAASAPPSVEMTVLRWYGNDNPGVPDDGTGRFGMTVLGGTGTTVLGAYGMTVLGGMG
jgi:hypothetical protein